MNFVHSFVNCLFISLVCLIIHFQGLCSWSLSWWIQRIFFLKISFTGEVDELMPIREPPRYTWPLLVNKLSFMVQSHVQFMWKLNSSPLDKYFTEIFLTQGNHAFLRRSQYKEDEHEIHIGCQEVVSLLASSILRLCHLSRGVWRKDA